MSHDHEHHHPHSHAVQHSHTAPASHPDGQVAPASRASYAGMSAEELASAYDSAWSVRRTATEAIIAMTEESIARAVAENLPGAHEVVLYEDHSHDAPHAHVRHVLDVHGEVLIAANGDDWHELEWTPEVDELVWDLYHLDRAGFHLGAEGRTRQIRVTSV